MVVAIDGPAGTGKSTIAHLLADKLSLTFVNSGSFYRAITLSALKNNINIKNEAELIDHAYKLSIDYNNSRLFLQDKDVEDLLHTDEIDANVSLVSSIPQIRNIVNKKVRALASKLNIICEGRDITTVVFPDAEFKFYLDASIEVQALRRFNQGVSDLSLEEIKQKIKERDELDKKKAVGALKKADDAMYIDTSDLTIEQVCEIMTNKIHIQGFNMAEKDVEMNESQDSKSNVQTQLQEEYLKSLESLEEGQLVEGEVIQVTSDQVFLDVGLKSEGKISISEFSAVPKIGDKVNVVLVQKESKHGEVIVSKQKADIQASKKLLRQAFQDKTAVDGVIEKQVKGGFEVNLCGCAKAFLPISQSDSQKVDRPEKLIGVKSKFYIDRMYSDNKVNIVVSRRKYLEESIETNREAFFNNVKIGDTVKGEVKSFTSFGAFIDLGGFDGLLHINDMSWGHVTRPKDFVKKGQEIELKVIRLDPNDKRINLSLKHFSEDPWLHFEDKYHVDDVVKGKVTKLTDFGAFIELEEGIEGLAHISEFSWVKKISKPEDVVKIGDEIECMILGYDIQAGRVSLGLKQVTANPWDEIGKKYPVGTKITGKVAKITNSGAFVEVEEGIDGYLSVDDLSWTKKIKHPGSELSVGKEIETVVLESDPEQHRIRLGVKQLFDDPWKDFCKEYHHGSILEGEIVSITDFGVFVRAPGGIEGLINKANLSEDREVSYEEAVTKYKVGDKISVFVVDVLPEKQKVSFSVRDIKRQREREEMERYMSSNQDEDEGSFTLGDMIKNKK